ncbi:MAG: hypothetical protein AB7O52_05440 [Planctomycetota bacterium]
MSRTTLKFLAYLMSLVVAFQAPLMAVGHVQRPAPAPGPIVVYPGPVAIPVTQQDILDTWALLYATVFAGSYNVNTAKLSLDQAVLAAGVYSGNNEVGAPFVLDVSSAVELDYTDMNLAPAVVQEALDQNVTWHVVEATTSTANGAITTSGMCFSRQSATIPFESVFIPLLDTPTTLAITQEGGEGSHGIGVICFLYPDFCNEDPDACADDCMDAYDDALQDAENAKDLATANEDARHQGQLDMLANNLNGAIDLANANYDSSMKTCAKIGVAGAVISLIAGFATLGAGLGLLGGTAVALATCQINAGNTRDQAINTANSNYNTGVANENTLHQTNMQIINNNYQAAVNAAQQALDDCLDDCYEICGWILECFFYEW